MKNLQTLARFNTQLWNKNNREKKKTTVTVMLFC